MTKQDRLSDIIPVEAVKERDIDLLILEELKCNQNFTDWFLQKTIDLSGNFELVGVWHSLTQIRLGESDLAFKVKIESKEIIFLLENKIDATLQPNQAERYRLRGRERVKKGECEMAYTVLIAPQKYKIRKRGFDFYLGYEEIRDWFMQQTDLGARAQYKADILQIAIEKLRRGYSAIVDERATSFWDAYYQYASEKYSHLKMRKPPAGVPKGSSFMVFNPVDIGLEKGDKIIHKGYGAVDLQFTGKAGKVEELVEQFSTTLN